MTEPTITRPNCRTEIKLNESLADLQEDPKSRDEKLAEAQKAQAELIKKR